MNSAMNKIICIILTISIIVALFCFVKVLKQSNDRKMKFIEYLENKGDYKKLIKFGFYNANGFKEGRRVPFLNKIIFEEYKKNKDVFLLEYSLYIKRVSKWLIALYFSIFFLFCCLATFLTNC